MPTRFRRTSPALVRSWKSWKLGIATAASTPMIATTIMSSINVKPAWLYSVCWLRMAVSPGTSGRKGGPASGDAGPPDEQRLEDGRTHTDAARTNLAVERVVRRSIDHARAASDRRGREADALLIGDHQAPVVEGVVTIQVRLGRGEVGHVRERTAEGAVGADRVVVVGRAFRQEAHDAVPRATQVDRTGARVQRVPDALRRTHATGETGRARRRDHRHEGAELAEVATFR